MEFLSTEAFAARNLVKPQSVRSQYCRQGSYFGVKPRKLPNGRLSWPDAETPRMNAGEVPFFPWGWTADYPDAMYFLSQVWYGPSPFNRSRWKNAEFDQLIERAQGIADAPARYKVYHQAEQVLMADWGTCPLIIRMQIALRKPNVQGVRLTPFRFLPFNTVKLN